MSNQLPAIRPEGLVGITLWLLQSERGKRPDPELLCQGLPQGRILRARVTEDGSSIAVTFWDQRDRRERNERIFDAEAFLALRLLCAPKTRVRVDHNHTANAEEPAKRELHYIMLFEDTSALRMIGDAKPNEAVNQLFDHHDLRRSNLYKVTIQTGPYRKQAHQGRESLKADALEAFDKLADDHWLRKALLREEYEWLIGKAFELLDMLPLGDGVRVAAE